MFGSGFFPRDLEVPEADAGPGEEEGEVPCYLPDKGSVDGRSGDEASEDGEGSSADEEETLTLRKVMEEAMRMREDLELATTASEGSADVSDTAVNAALREIGVDPESIPRVQSPLDPSFNAQRMGNEAVLEPALVQRVESGAAGADEEWRKSPPHWWPHGWRPQKKYPDEDESMASWRSHSNHYLVVSNAGKPIYSRYGDEHRLAAIGGVIQALVSYVSSAGGGSDVIQSLRAGQHQTVFLIKGPLYLVAISRSGTPELILRHNLSLLRKLFFVLLTNDLEAKFARNPNLDLKPLLEGTEGVFASLVHSFSWDPSIYLHAFKCLRLSSWLRTTASGALKAAVSVSNSSVVLAMLFSGFRVVTMANRKKHKFHAMDLVLLLNLVNSSDSFREHLVDSLKQSGALADITEAAQHPQLSFRELLPQLDPLLSAATNKGPSDPHRAADADASASVPLGPGMGCDFIPMGSSGSAAATGDAHGAPAAERRGNAGTAALSREESSLFGGMPGDRVASGAPQIQGDLIDSRGPLWGPSGLWHFMFKSVQLGQYVSCDFTSWLAEKDRQKRILRGYQQIYASMHADGMDPSIPAAIKTQCRKTSQSLVLGWSTTEFEFFATFDSLASKSSAVAVCNKICRSLQSLEAELFLLGPVRF